MADDPAMQRPRLAAHRVAALATSLTLGVASLVLMPASPASASAPAYQPVTGRITALSGVEPAGSGSFQPDISTDGRFVAFTSRDTNLIPGFTPVGDDIYVADRQTGVITLASVTRVAALLERHGVTKGSRVAIAAANHAPYPIAWWATPTIACPTRASPSWRACTSTAASTRAGLRASSPPSWPVSFWSPPR